jgi:hypothetical protein
MGSPALSSSFFNTLFAADPVSRLRLWLTRKAGEVVAGLDAR